MIRVKSGGYSEVIGAAYDLIPVGLHRMIRPDFFCGADPVFAGLHDYHDTSDGRSYRNVAQCVYEHNQKRTLPKSLRRVTIVLPSERDVSVVVHEMGHVLHEEVGFEWRAAPVTWYAETDRFEAFAEAFTSWLVPGYAPRPDDATLALLESLA